MSTTLKVTREKVAEYAEKHRAALSYHDERYGNARAEAQDLPLPSDLELALGNINDWVNGGDSFTDRVADLSGLDLSGLDLSHANLSFALLDHTNLTNTNLSHAVLRYTPMRHANLTGTNLTGAYMVETDLQNATIETDLTAAAMCENVNVQGAQGAGAIIHETERHPNELALQAALTDRTNPAVSIDDDWVQAREIPSGLLLDGKAPKEVGVVEVEHEPTAEELIAAHESPKAAEFDRQLEELAGPSIDEKIAEAYKAGDRLWADKLLDLRNEQTRNVGGRG